MGLLSDFAVCVLVRGGGASCGRWHWNGKVYHMFVEERP